LTRADHLQQRLRRFAIASQTIFNWVSDDMN
jgi:hypothetical protein